MSRSQPRRRRFGTLDSIFVEGQADGPTVVLFHGYGASMEDLAPLASYIQAPKGTNWVFPNGHQAIQQGGHMEGRGWFPISMAELEKTMVGQALDLSAIAPPGLKKARELAFQLIEKLDTPIERVVLGGFSQGAMLATDVALRLKSPPAGLAILSGTLTNAPEWKELAVNRKGLPFFQSHGRMDQVLHVEMAKRLEKLLREAGLSGQLQEFGGAHEIPPEVLIQLGGFLRKVLK